MGPDGAIFIVCIIIEVFLLSLSVYFVITLSDLEYGYLNTRMCCNTLNFWVIPEIIGHDMMEVILLVTGHWYLFILSSPLAIWLNYKLIMKPSGAIGLFDPTEIHNGHRIKKCMMERMLLLGSHLISFFIYMYCDGMDSVPFNVLGLVVYCHVTLRFHQWGKRFDSMDDLFSVQRKMTHVF